MGNMTPPKGCDLNSHGLQEGRGEWLRLRKHCSSGEPHWCQICTTEARLSLRQENKMQFCLPHISTPQPRGQELYRDEYSAVGTNEAQREVKDLLTD